MTIFLLEVKDLIFLSLEIFEFLRFFWITFL